MLSGTDLVKVRAALLTPVATLPALGSLPYRALRLKSAPILAQRQTPYDYVDYLLICFQDADR